MDLDNLAVMSVASRVKNYPLIEEVNLSDNKVMIGMFAHF